MKQANSELIKQKGEIRLLKIETRHGEEVFCVVGNGPTKHYDDYDDALEVFNSRWMKEEYGE